MEPDDLAAHPLARRFHRLTPDSVLSAVEASGRRPTGRAIALNSYENRVYQLELDDGAWVVGKFYRPGRWDRAQIGDEHRFLADLRAADLPVVCPVEIRAGETLGEVDGILYALFPRAGGRAPQELDDSQVRLLGRLLARLHNAGAAGDAPARPRVSPARGRADLGWLVAHDALPAEARAGYVAVAEALLARIEPLWADVPMHRIHGDAHLGNLLWTAAGPTLLDFDDCAVGPAVQDVWMLAASADAEGRRQRDLLVEAYRTLRDFAPSWLRLVEPLRALRYQRYATWIAQRWDDPIFPRTFPQFGAVRWWQEQADDLREQIARIDREAE